MTEKKKISEMEPDEIKKAVRDTYSRLAKGNTSDEDDTDEVTPSSSGCCG